MAKKRSIIYEELDGFEKISIHPKRFKPEVVALCTEIYECFEKGDLSYYKLAQYHKSMNKIGWTFDYGLDAEPHDLRKII